jgi:hypothetical protein
VTFFRESARITGRIEDASYLPLFIRHTASQHTRGQRALSAGRHAGRIGRELSRISLISAPLRERWEECDLIGLHLLLN